MIENFDSSVGIKKKTLSQKLIFWGFHCNGNNFWLDKTDSVGSKWSSFKSFFLFTGSNNQFNFLSWNSILLCPRCSSQVWDAKQACLGTYTRVIWCRGSIFPIQFFGSINYIMEGMAHPSIFIHLYGNKKIINITKLWYLTYLEGPLIIK